MVRVSGLASGMDIDEIVKSMMQAERVPLDKLNQKKTYTEWQRDDYRAINSSLLELDTLIRDGIGKQASFIKKTVSVSDPNALSIKNINSTSDFSGTMEVKNLAVSAMMKNSEKLSIDPAVKLLADGAAAQEISIQAIDKNGVLGENKKITITADDTLNSLITKINSNTDVTAFYDQQSGQLSFTAKNTGDIADGAEIKLTGDFFANTLKMDADNQTANGTAGVNATVVYNGLEISRSSNVINLNGAEFTLKAKTDGPVTFSSTADVDAILDTVTQFVSKYNELIAKIKDKTSETKYRDFAPLTAEQKKEMSEDEIKLWEEKAKSGTLKNDSTLSNLLTTMRSSLYTSVSGISGTNALSKIGITTTSNYLEGGKLTIDEDKLRAAISEDPNAVYQLFMANGTEKGEMGLARRLRSDLDGAMKAITEKAGKASSVNNTFTIGKQLNGLDTSISAFEDRLAKLETRYYSQFTAMEQAIQKANSQSTSLSSYFSS
ncbi:flagellar hook-associated protein 2 [Bacillus massiliglaciei]|uniref:flagellar hook-associated protein 2 n=1 Tax=Bacillus massiliglaciei TaxID=1816693 RepID=UPI000AF53F7C|nr:flagellar hook-associated protein 2 [Bacillus massiliglaciei]